MDLVKFKQLRENFMNLQDEYVKKLSETRDPNMPIEDVVKIAQAAYKIGEKADFAEYEYKRYIASTELKEFEEMSFEDLKEIFPMLIMDGAPFQTKYIVDIFDKKKKEREEKK